MSTIARVTIEQYDRMIAGGVFETGLQRQRIELIEGELREMSPIGPRHENVADLLNRWSLKNTHEDQVRVRVQQSIGLARLDSVPEPDLAWVRERDYSQKRPQSTDVFLVIEVADSSVDYDEGEKASLYAAAGIRDYWVVDIPGRSVLIYRNPRNGKYGSMETFGLNNRVHPLAFPKIVLRVSSLVPSM